MELILTGTEVHVLRETLESDILNLEREMTRTGSPSIREELKEKGKVLKSVLERFPVEFANV
jgi:hypothetical protein